MPTMNKQRLETLAKFLDTLPPEKRRKFDMNAWIEVDGDDVVEALPVAVERGWLKPERIVPDCGTSACALGWATTIPQFTKAGLHMGVEGGGIVPTYRDYTEFDAAEQFFGLTYGQAAFIFGVNEDGKTPKQVARRIRDVIAGRADTSMWDD